MTDQRQNNKVNVTVSGAKFRATIDTGATVNVIDRDTFNKMQDMALNRNSTKAFADDTKSPVQFLGKFEAVIKTRKRISVATFYSKGRKKRKLLSLSTAQEFGLVSWHKIKLDIDKTQTPKARPQLRIPYHIGEKMKNAFTELEQQDIIEKVTENEATSCMGLSHCGSSQKRRTSSVMC